MFEIVWTDPEIETVGQRKARKEKEQEAKDARSQSESQASDRHSVLTTSTNRSSSSTNKASSNSSKNGGDSVKSSSLFGFTLKKKRTSTKSKINLALDLYIPIPEGNTVPPSLPTASTFGSTFSSTDFALDDRSPKSMASLDGKYLVEPVDHSGNNSRMVSLSGSMLSNSTVITPLFPQSPMGKSTAEAMSQGRGQAAQDDNLDSSTMTTAETLGDSICDPNYHTAVSETTSAAQSGYYHPHTDSSPSRVQMDMATNAANATACRMIHLSLSPPPRDKHVNLQPIQASKIKFTAHDPDRWKAPEEWEVASYTDEANEQLLVTARRDSDTVNVNMDDSIQVPNLEKAQREITRMALYVPKSITNRLDPGGLGRDQWLDVLDPIGYKEAEMVKKRLMLFALRAWSESGQKMMFMHAMPKSLSKGTKVLALFETEATTSYIAAVHPDSEVTHLAPTALSPVLFPNVRPLHSPVVSKATHSFAQDTFEAVYCHDLPSLLPSQEIPGFLRSVYKILKLGGVLHLVLFDPTPVTSSLGPRLRQWMEDHLILNLERKFRCTSPKKLIPGWLNDEYLRADKTTVKAYRCPVIFSAHEDQWALENRGSTGSKANSDDSKASSYVRAKAPSMVGNEEKDEQDRLELQITVAKMMWRETWGSSVVASQWWWEVPAIVEECERLGTYWEYSIVEATKCI